MGCELLKMGEGGSESTAIREKDISKEGSSGAHLENGA